MRWYHPEWLTVTISQSSQMPESLALTLIADETIGLNEVF